jgi:hypothetical protein
MGKIPTAEEFLNNIEIWDGIFVHSHNAKKAMIQFAKLHVEAALNAVSKEEIHFSYSGKLVTGYILEKDSILNAYPLTNIK